MTNLTTTPINPDTLTYDEALTMAALIGFEFQECDWCTGNTRYWSPSCFYGYCPTHNREHAVWAFLLLKGVTDSLPRHLAPDDVMG